MGHRANYIIKENNQLNIHYSHWRANAIASDLYLGETRFLKFVNECQKEGQIMDNLWIEGCVVVDKDNKHLCFWTFQLSLSAYPPTIDYYLTELSKKWEGWKISLLKHQMYDVEKVLNIDYVSKQELCEIERTTEDEIVNDKVEKWVNAVVIIKDGSTIFVTKTGNLSIESLVGYGQEVVQLLKNKQGYDLPNEDEEGTSECMIIDIEKKKVFINECKFGLNEVYKDRWKDYEIITGDYGYIGVLNLAGIPFSGEQPSEELIKEQFQLIVKIKDGTDPLAMAKRLTQDNKDVQFNPDFFDVVKPKRSLLERLKEVSKNFLGKK